MTAPEISAALEAPDLTVADYDALLAILHVRDTQTDGHPLAGLTARVQAHRDALHARTPHPASIGKDS